jgi:hypothetical protein
MKTEEKQTPREMVGYSAAATGLFDLLVKLGADENEAVIYVSACSIGNKEEHTLPTVKAVLDKIEAMK